MIKGHLAQFTCTLGRYEETETLLTCTLGRYEESETLPSRILKRYEETETLLNPTMGRQEKTETTHPHSGIFFCFCVRNKKQPEIL